MHLPASGELTATLAEFVLAATPETLPASTAAAAKEHILDTLGAAVYGSSLPHCRITVDLFSGDGPYTVLCRGKRANHTNAAFLNGVAASAFELDSGGAFVHPGACIVPAAIAMVEWLELERRCNVSGGDFLTAVAVGYEIAVRLGEWVGFSPEREVGWHTPSFHGAIGAAAACSYILGSLARETAHGLALAADMAGGGLVHARNDSKRFHTARAAETGVISALLASRGLEGETDVLEHDRWGYLRALRFGTGPHMASEAENEHLVAGLGSSFRSFDRLPIKYYPFHSVGQSIIDNINKIKSREILEPDNVAGIKVHLSRFMFEHEKMLEPAASLSRANFSLPYAAALPACCEVLRLTEEKAEPGVFVGGLEDENVMSMQRRISFEPSGELDRENPYTMDTIVDVTLVSGDHLIERTRYAARGSDSKEAIRFDSTNQEGLVNKFINLTRGVLAASAVEPVLGEVLRLDEAENVGQLITVLSREGSSGE